MTSAHTLCPTCRTPRPVFGTFCGQCGSSLLKTPDFVLTSQADFGTSDHVSSSNRQLSTPTLVQLPLVANYTELPYLVVAIVIIAFFVIASVLEGLSGPSTYSSHRGHVGLHGNSGNTSTIALPTIPITQSSFLFAVTQEIPSVAAAVNSGATSASGLTAYGRAVCSILPEDGGAGGSYLAIADDISADYVLNQGIGGINALNLGETSGELFVSLAIEDICPNEALLIPGGYPGAKQVHRPAQSLGSEARLTSDDG